MATILLVENEVNQRLLYQIVLEDEGYEIVVAETGRQALQKVEEAQPDLVVLDLQMPDINGIDLLNRMKGLNSRLPVIILSVYESFKFMTWAADAYVIKNSNLDLLKGEIDRVLLAQAIVGRAPAPLIFR